MSRYPVRDVTSRTSGPSVHAAGDGLQGNYSAILHAAPSGGTCKVVVPDLNLTTYYTALCSTAFTGAPGDRVLVAFDENKQPWVLSPSGVSAGKINGVTVPLTSAAWIVPTLINSFTATEGLGYLKDPIGWMQLRGALSTGTSGTVAFVLPVGYRPGVDSFYAAVQAGGLNSVEVQANGNVIPFFSSSALRLTNVRFLAEN